MSTVCLASRVGHAGRMLLSSAICRLLCLLLCAQGLCNMSLQPGRYSLVSLTDLTHPNRCTDVYWYALNLVQVMQVPCSCLLLSAGCCAVAACRVLCHVNTGGYRLQGLLHRYIKTIVLNSSVLLSSYCADAAVYGLFCSGTAACTGFVPHVNQTGTSCKFCWTKLIHRNKQACTLACMGTSLSSGCAVAAISVFCCLPVVVVAAACTGFVQHAHTAR
jgi:hypothetical protein